MSNVYVQKFISYRHLLIELVKKGIKLKYRRSYLGILWSLIEPLMTMAVLTVVFTKLLGRDAKDLQIPFAVYILIGRLMYTYFSTGTKTAMRSIRANSSMIKKVYVPKYLYPLSSTLYTYVIFLISLIDLFAVAILMGVKPSWYMFQAIIPILLIFFLTFGVGMILSTIAVFFRDLEYIWDVLTMLIMYTSAVFYTTNRFEGTWMMYVFKFNPLYRLIECFRDSLSGQPLHPYGMLYTGLFCLGVVLFGFFIFYKKQDDFILHI